MFGEVAISRVKLEYPSKWIIHPSK